MYKFDLKQSENENPVFWNCLYSMNGTDWVGGDSIFNRINDPDLKEKYVDWFIEIIVKGYMHLYFVDVPENYNRWQDIINEKSVLRDSQLTNLLQSQKDLIHDYKEMGFLNDNSSLIDIAQKVVESYSDFSLSVEVKHTDYLISLTIPVIWIQKLSQNPGNFQLSMYSVICLISKVTYILLTNYLLDPAQDDRLNQQINELYAETWIDEARFYYNFPRNIKDSDGTLREHAESLRHMGIPTSL